MTPRPSQPCRERGQDLIRGLGYEIEPEGRTASCAPRRGAQAVAVFLQDTEQADQPAARFENQTPVTYALSHADRDNMPVGRGRAERPIRLYSTSTSGAAGQRGRAETFVELNLPLLPSERQATWNCCSPPALAEGGTISEIQQASSTTPATSPRGSGSASTKRSCRAWPSRSRGAEAGPTKKDLETPLPDGAHDPVQADVRRLRRGLEAAAAARQRRVHRTTLSRP